jgi:hypothetical protein
MSLLHSDEAAGPDAPLESHGCEVLREGARHTVYVNRSAWKSSSVPGHGETNEFLARKTWRELEVQWPKCPPWVVEGPMLPQVDQANPVGRPGRAGAALDAGDPQGRGLGEPEAVVAVRVKDQALEGDPRSRCDAALVDGSLVLG